MKPRVYNAKGMEKDWHWLEGKYGPMEWRLAEHLSQGEEYWGLLRIQESFGNATIKARTLGLDGNASRDQHVACHFTSAPHQPHGCESQWRDEFVHQKTDGDGFTGFGIGRGSYYWYQDPAPQNVGPHILWVCGGTKSDAIMGVGMLKGTDHHGMMDLVFGLTNYDEQVNRHPPIEHDHNAPPANVSLELRLLAIEQWIESFGS